MTSKARLRRAAPHRSQYLQPNAWLAEQTARGGTEIEAVILAHCADLDDAARVWAWDILEAARAVWHAKTASLIFGHWLRTRAGELIADVAKTFLTKRCASIDKTEILEVW